MNELFQLLKQKGGHIQLVDDCTLTEIVDAKETGRYYEDEEGQGFIYFEPGSIVWQKN